MDQRNVLKPITYGDLLAVGALEDVSVFDLVEELVSFVNTRNKKKREGKRYLRPAHTVRVGRVFGGAALFCVVDMHLSKRIRRES